MDLDKRNHQTSDQRFLAFTTFTVNRKIKISRFFIVFLMFRMISYFFVQLRLRCDLLIIEYCGYCRQILRNVDVNISFN